MGLGRLLLLPAHLHSRCGIASNARTGSGQVDSSQPMGWSVHCTGSFPICRPDGSFPGLAILGLDHLCIDIQLLRLVLGPGAL